MEQSNIKYDKLTDSALNLLTDLNSIMNKISLYNNELIRSTIFGSNHGFIEFINTFNISKYYGFKSTGFLECMVITGSYKLGGLCYWKNDLIMASLKKFFISVRLFKSLKTNKELLEYTSFRAIGNDLDRAIKITAELLQTIKQFNLPC